MSTEDWDPEPSRPGLVRRLISPEAGARPSTLAFGLGAAAAVAFVTSLVMEWSRVTYTLGRDTFSGVNPGDEITAVATPGSTATMGEVYLFGMIALLGLLGAVLTRPDLALRLRMGVAGVGVGLLGVVVGIVLQFPSQSLTSVTGLFGWAGAEELRDTAKVAYEPGVAAAAVAVLFAVAGVWLAARPAVRAAGEFAAAHHYAVVEAPPARSVGQVGQVDELTVSASEPLPMSTDPWSR